MIELPSSGGRWSRSSSRTAPSATATATATRQLVTLQKASTKSGQVRTGKTILLCATQDLVLEHLLGLATAESFEGTTEEGLQVEVDHMVSATNYLSEAVASGTYVACRVGHLMVSRQPQHSRRHLEFLLTNLSGIHSDVSFVYRGLPFVVQPLAESTVSLKRLQVLRGVLPTARLVVSTQASLKRVTDAADELCYYSPSH